MRLTQRQGYTVETLTRNIIDVIESANARERAEGLAWYRAAAFIAGELATEVPGYSENFEGACDAAAGIIAALSPRTRWGTNVDRALTVIRLGDCAGFQRSREHARAILSGADPYGILRGPKTRAFCEAIRSGGESGVAVIDTWATRAATRGRYDEPSKGRYTDLAQAYAVAARRLSLRTHDAQAIAWIVTRGKAA